MRKIRCFLLALICFILCFNVVYAKTSSAEEIYNTDKVNKGVITINYAAASTKKVKLLITKDGKQYSYNLSGKTAESFPLQMGSGLYTISIMENISGNSYKAISQNTVDAVISDDKDVYLNSVQNINWDSSMAAVKKAKELTKNAKTNDEKVKIIYNYIINNVKYDSKKLNNISSVYLPNINDTLKSEKGICYDYSSLFASMLRSLNIPTKMAMGYTKNVNGYHAWNEVYLESSKQWVVVDTTYDSQVKSKIKVTMVKNADLYQKVKEY